MANDEFRQIDGFPAYRISRDGEIQSCWSRGSPKRMTDDWHPLKPIRGDHYLIVNLSDGVRKHTKLIHRLVLAAFVGPCPPGLVCCHNDGDPTNNHVDNLRWDTYAANEADKVRHGTRPEV